jgi:hypothetical protein
MMNAQWRQGFDLNKIFLSLRAKRSNPERGGEAIWIATLRSQ